MDAPDNKEEVGSGVMSASSPDKIDISRAGSVDAEGLARVAVAFCWLVEGTGVGLGVALVLGTGATECTSVLVIWLGSCS